MDWFYPLVFTRGIDLISNNLPSRLTMAVCDGRMRDGYLWTGEPMSGAHCGVWVFIAKQMGLRTLHWKPWEIGDLQRTMLYWSDKRFVNPFKLTSTILDNPSTHPRSGFLFPLSSGSHWDLSSPGYSDVSDPADSKMRQRAPAVLTLVCTMLYWTFHSDPGSFLGRTIHNAALTVRLPPVECFYSPTHL